jgi:hypothetical protein
MVGDTGFPLKGFFPESLYSQYTSVLPVVWGYSMSRNIFIVNDQHLKEFVFVTKSLLNNDAVRSFELRCPPRINRSRTFEKQISPTAGFWKCDHIANGASVT